MLRGGPANKYKKISTYIYMLNTAYPNSHIRMHKSAENEFMYLFIVSHLMISGFEFCKLQW